MNTQLPETRKLELMLNGVTDSLDRAFLRTAIAELLTNGFTYAPAQGGWVSPQGRDGSTDEAVAWIGTPKEGGRPCVTLEADTREVWEKSYGRTIEPLFRATRPAFDMQRAHQLAEEIAGGQVRDTYVFDHAELEHFLALLLGGKA